MRSFKLIFMLIVLISLFACEPQVTFTEPQPTNTASLSKFPKRLHGNYLSLADNSMLTINDNLIQRIYDFDYKIHINDIDSNFRLSGDTLIDISTQEKTIIKREGDSLTNHFYGIDTLFQISNENIVKKFKGYFATIF